MKKTLELTLSPEIAFDENELHQHIKSSLQIKEDNTFHIRLLKRSIDARSRQIKVNLQAEIYVDEMPEPLLQYQPEYKDVSKSNQAIIVGAGPAGLFAALRLIELGIKPVIIELLTKIPTTVLVKAAQVLTVMGNYIHVLKNVVT